MRHENAVLCRQIVGLVRYEPTDWFWFAALSTLIPRRRWREVFPVTRHGARRPDGRRTGFGGFDLDLQEPFQGCGQ
ncbi:hypothetical protein [Streptomyces sp. NPDC060077]|uniref:hypothetical protein n=1 Tax=Streptomyces sp. NPDC060077 TaxID=3347052 RepID=UPI00364E8A2F